MLVGGGGFVVVVVVVAQAAVPTGRELVRSFLSVAVARYRYLSSSPPSVQARFAMFGLINQCCLCLFIPVDHVSRGRGLVLVEIRT